MTFYGEFHLPHEAHGHAHESPPSMTGPLGILAICAIFVGGVFAWPLADPETGLAASLFDGFLAHTPSLAAGAVAATRVPYQFHYDVAAMSTVVALAGIGLAMYLYLGERSEVRALAQFMRFEWVTRLSDGSWIAGLSRWPPVSLVYRAASKVGLGWLAALVGYVVLLIVLVVSAPLLILYFLAPYSLSQHKFYFDEIYGALVVAPLRAAAALSYWLDRYLIDGLVNLLGKIPPAAGSLMRTMQMGLVQFYALAMVLGILLLLVARAWWAG